MAWDSGGVDPVLLRERMVQREVVERGISDQRVIEALRAIPRHLFVDPALATRAYTGQPLPIGSGQTISRPHVVALMTELLAPEPHHRVLEVGSGSGYQAAVLSRLCAHVDTVERIPALVQRARRALARLGIDNVVVHESDGSVGLPHRPPYPRILVAAGAPEMPALLFEQLENGGRMVLPVADPEGGEVLQVIERSGARRLVQRSVPCAFVPLIGEGGHAGSTRLGS